MRIWVSVSVCVHECMYSCPNAEAGTCLCKRQSSWPIAPKSRLECVIGPKQLDRIYFAPINYRENRSCKCEMGKRGSIYGLNGSSILSTLKGSFVPGCQRHHTFSV